MRAEEGEENEPSWKGELMSDYEQNIASESVWSFLLFSPISGASPGNKWSTESLKNCATQIYTEFMN